MALTWHYADGAGWPGFPLSNRSRARCVPDQPDDQGIWRTLTDRASCCRPAAMLVTALTALIPKLTVQYLRSPSHIRSAMVSAATRSLTTTADHNGIRLEPIEPEPARR
jgi:hypothetical protein